MLVLPLQMTDIKVRPGEVVLVGGLVQTCFPSMELEPPLDSRTPEKPPGLPPGQRPKQRAGFSQLCRQGCGEGRAKPHCGEHREQG